MQTACVTSLQPLVTSNTATIDDRLVGTWKNNDHEYTVQKFFASDLYKKIKIELEHEKERNDNSLHEAIKKDSLLFSKSYVISFTKDDVRYEMFGSLIRLNGQLFINFTPAYGSRFDSSGDEREISLTDRINTYTIARLRILNTNRMEIDFINGGYIHDQVKKGRLKIKNERDDLYDTFLITASTTDLQQFLEKYGKDNRFYEKQNSITLKR